MEIDKTAKETLTDPVLEFLEAAIHEFLFSWLVYPKESFEQRVLYDIPIHMSRHPLLCEYIHSMLNGCRTWLLQGELEKLCVVLLCNEGRATETLVIELVWIAALETTNFGKDHQRALGQLEEAFRMGMAALVAAPVSHGAKIPDRNNMPQTFRILAHTAEGTSSRENFMNDATASNSWVLADPFWHKNQQGHKKIIPVKTIHAEASLIQLNVYIEKQ
ncbi:mitotic spindle assembly checkpoint protein mad2b [Plasmopara halstedii]|uniref:Mitotic spindle assembly checkpoint protein mad2b n=1 Tax=Plasmopara halstedii TaxID=4781 RepID=A0A0P1B5I7_PLAHL|nr:mitotic spindle assembly checkpoint protein mad2b [Plasmopara halstedii]CEG50081.1 mitotic spindle assembly checkpoint protein mad2b [Plasmopara halstedii]|eukprot:XP_024586450.1 mitotic spindle assembly checkpoint protein mad2b [Plasmopara halstedii]